MLVCYDKLFPEAARALALDGAEIIASHGRLARLPPAARAGASPQDRQTRHFNLVDAARAVENQVVWVSSNQTGRSGPLRFLGNAKIVDPDGVVLARTGAQRRAWRSPGRRRRRRARRRAWASTTSPTVARRVPPGRRRPRPAVPWLATTVAVAADAR